jgi:hypothetical protein
VRLQGYLVGDIKDYDEPASDLGIDIGDLRIDLIVDLLLGCRSACHLASWAVAPTGQNHLPNSVFLRKLSDADPLGNGLVGY